MVTSGEQHGTRKDYTMKLTSAQQTLINALKDANGELPAHTKGIKINTVRTLVAMGLIKWSNPIYTEMNGRTYTTHTTITLIKVI